MCMSCVADFSAKMCTQLDDSTSEHNVLIGLHYFFVACQPLREASPFKGVHHLVSKLSSSNFRPVFHILTIQFEKNAFHLPLYLQDCKLHYAGYFSQELSKEDIA